MNYVKFLRCSPKLYQGLIHKDNDTLYFVYEEDETTAELYLGTKLITGVDISSGKGGYLSQLKDVFINEGLSHSQLLVYDAVSQNWVNKSMEEALSVFIGATDISRGKAGLVPVPKVGQKDFYLKGDGTWSQISSDNVEVAVSGPEAPQTQTLTAVISHLQERINAAPSEEKVKLWVEEGLAAAPNIIKSVSDVFTIDDNKQLNLNTLPISKIKDLEERLSSIGDWQNFS